MSPSSFRGWEKCNGGCCVKLVVGGLGKEVHWVFRIFEIIDESEAAEDKPFVFAAYEDDCSDSAMGILASMSVLINYIGNSGEEKTFTEHILRAFERCAEEGGRPACQIVISPIGRKLVNLVFDQRDRESNDEERSRFVQWFAEDLGLSLTAKNREVGPSMHDGSSDELVGTC